jgi:hypothetical protein
VPAAVRIDLEVGAALVRGRLDRLAVLEDGTALAAGLSLGSSSRADPQRMALWRGWLGSVARALLPAQVPLRVTIGFLADASAAEPSAPAAAELDAVREAVQALARRWLTRPAESGLELLEPARCRALRCGYARFCHGPKSMRSDSRDVL